MSYRENPPPSSPKPSAVPQGQGRGVVSGQDFSGPSRHLPPERSAAKYEREIDMLRADRTFFHSTSLRLQSDCAALQAQVAAKDAEIAALKAQLEWRPMEDAPRDGTRIVCLDPNGRPGLFCCSGGAWWDAYQDRYGEETLLGWLPLPAAPTEAEPPVQCADCDRLAHLCPIHGKPDCAPERQEGGA